MKMSTQKFTREIVVAIVLTAAAIDNVRATNETQRIGTSAVAQPFPESEPQWLAKARQITVGMTRREAESLLPPNAAAGKSWGSSGRYRAFYSIGTNWQVTLVYESPVSTNMFITMKSADGKEVTEGPLSGWSYERTPEQRVMAGPFVTRTDSVTNRLDDPFGCFRITTTKGEPTNAPYSQPARTRSEKR